MVEGCIRDSQSRTARNEVNIDFAEEQLTIREQPKRISVVTASHDRTFPAGPAAPGIKSVTFDPGIDAEVLEAQIRGIPNRDSTRNPIKLKSLADFTGSKRYAVLQR